MTKAFVTGATGFLGRHLLRALQRRGIAPQGFGRSDGDVRDAEALRTAVLAAKPDWIFHMAADTRRSRDVSLLPEMFQTNVVGTMNLLCAAQTVAPSALVAVGTFEEYGDNPTPFREDMAPRPLSPYGLTKSLASILVAGAGRSVLPATVIRFPVLYGDGQAADTFVGGACTAIKSGGRFPMTRGEQSRDFLYIDDAVDALIAAAENIDVCRGEVFNACTGVALSLREAVHTIGAIAGRKDFADIGARPYRPNEQMYYVGDCTKIAQRIGWKAQTPFAEGIRKTLKSG